jgi:porin
MKLHHLSLAIGLSLVFWGTGSASLAQETKPVAPALLLYSPTDDSKPSTTKDSRPTLKLVSDQPADAVCEAPAAPEAPPPFGGPICTRPKLTGDWCGFREDLRCHGITFDVSTALYYQGLASGGLKDQFELSGRADYRLNIDGQKAGLWQGLLINLHGETVYGDSVNDLTGAFMPVNVGRLVPVPSGDVTALTGIKITQALSENFAVFGGKINTFDGFEQPFLPSQGLDVGGFMNMGMIFSPVLIRTVPYSTWGGGAAVLVNGKPAASVMVLDTHNTPTTTGFPTFFDNGVTILATGGLPSNFFDMPGIHALMGTYSSGRYADTDTTAFSLISRVLRGLPAVEKISGSWSLAYTFQQTLWIDPCDKTRTWGLFGYAGIGDNNPNPYPWAVGIGVAGSSPLPGRKLDTFGIAYYYMNVSSDLKNFARRLIPLQDEQGFELFYNVGVTPWCHITPDLQVIDPARARVDTSVVLGLRAKIDF